MDVAKRYHTLRLSLCWDAPTLAPALAALRFIVADHVNGRTIHSAAVDTRGRVYLNKEWCGALSDGEANFVILHEVLHPLLRHHERTGGRDPRRWGVATDLVINDAIMDLRLKSVTRPAESVFRDKIAPGLPAGLSAEEVYERLRGLPLPDGGIAGAGCGTIDAVDDDADDLSPVEWRNIAETVANLARNAGAGGQSLVRLLTIPPSRVRWRALLSEVAAHAASQAGNDHTTWARRSRRSPPGMILPGTRRNIVHLCVIIDSSGSMSDDEVAACVAEAHAAITAAGAEATLIIHDHVVQTVAQIRLGAPVSAIQDRVKGRGGTLFAPAYEAAAAIKTSFAALIHFTDGYPCDAWPPRPPNCRRGIIALTPEGGAARVPTTGWRIVKVLVPGRE